MSAPPALVVLAAGASRRLGSCKALADLGGRPALLRLLDGALACHGSALVVVGPDAAPIRERLAGRAEVRCVENPSWRAGRTGSLARAVRELPGRDLVVAPVDCPLVSAAVHRALLASWAEAGAPPRGWWAPRVVPAGGGRARYGHPVLLGRELAGEVPDMPADRPLRELRARAEPLGWVDVEDLSVLDDLDTPADLRGIARRVPDLASGADPGGSINAE